MKSAFPLVHPQDDGIRPRGGPHQCFYCNQKIGIPHLTDCVAVHKKVKLRLTLKVEVDQPHAWTAEHIEDVFETDPVHVAYYSEELSEGTVRHCEVLSMDDMPNVKIREPAPILNWTRVNTAEMTSKTRKALMAELEDLSKRWCVDAGVPVPESATLQFTVGTMLFDYLMNKASTYDTGTWDKSWDPGLFLRHWVKTYEQICDNAEWISAGAAHLNLQLVSWNDSGADVY
jgi:hypothetical protein